MRPHTTGSAGGPRSRRPPLLECWDLRRDAVEGAVIPLAQAIPELSTHLRLGDLVVVRGPDGACRPAVVSHLDLDGTLRVTLGPLLSRGDLAEVGMAWSGHHERLRRTRLVVCP